LGKIRVFILPILRIDLLKSPIAVTTIHPGFIRSEINEKVKSTPFMIDTETGCGAILKAIEKEGDSYYVPAWPWNIMAFVTRHAPLSFMAKMS